MPRILEGKVVIATHNAGKLREMRDLLAPHGLEVVSAGELDLPEPEETGTTFRENARIKAEAAAQSSGLPAIADDSGICVAVLGGEPGIYSARWAGPGKDFFAAMARIEELLQSRQAELQQADPRREVDRSAWFVSALTIAWPDGHLEEFEGRVDGTLVWPPRGPEGFGYDPAFLPEGETRTFGEMSAVEKHGLPPLGRGLSHRARAFVLLEQACLK
jgi:XTP/dITP diphosphohydrolase